MDTEETLRTIEVENNVTLKEFQRNAIKSIVRNDVFVSVPTGSGKTFCFSFLPRFFDLIRKMQGSIVIVVSPLISLMVDQVNNLKRRDISCEFINETQNCPEVKRRVKSGAVPLVFISPEALLESSWRSILTSDVYTSNLQAIVFDEAHCISEW